MTKSNEKTIIIQPTTQNKAKGNPKTNGSTLFATEKIGKMVGKKASVITIIKIP